MISIFIFYEILRVIFHLQLLQNIGPIPCDGQYIHVAYLTPSSLYLTPHPHDDSFPLFTDNQ